MIKEDILKNKKIPKLLPKRPLTKAIQGRLADALDVSYNVSQIKINTMEEFYKELYEPFLSGASIYYRGEKCSSFKRRMLPTYLRSEKIIDMKDIFTQITGDTLYNYYTGKQAFITVYNTLYGAVTPQNMYNMLAFAQHYLGMSPFIDFSKSIYVSLSFALKDRTEFDKDIVIYTAFDIGDDDTTTDIAEVNKWLSDYSVGIVRADNLSDVKELLEGYENFTGVSPQELFKDHSMLESIFEGVSPVAKLIDIPTNDLMKYQQGVFLLLNNFALIDTAYFTKTVRQSFVIKKYVIDKDICPLLKALVLDKAPQYRYECLLDIAKAVKD